jgi:CRISPR-associated RAMP protein (TIGR02581 family)
VEREWCVLAEQVRDWREEVRRRRQQEGEREQADNWFAAEVWRSSCRICRVFGSPWLASRVRLADLPCIRGGAVERRDGVSIDRDKETVANKYDFEAVPAATTFRLKVVADNLEQTELGLLWLGLRELEQGRLALGGFKGRGLGQVELKDCRLRWVNARDRAFLKSYILGGTLTDVTPQQAGAWLESLVAELGEGASNAPTVSQ